MRFFPENILCCVKLRFWCIAGGIIELIIFLIPSFYYLVVWNEKQEDNRILFGIILTAVLTLSVCFSIGAYNREKLFLMVWIVGTIIVQFLVNLLYSLIYLFNGTTVKIWGYSDLEIFFTVLQTVVGLFCEWLAIGYYIILDERDKMKEKLWKEKLEELKIQKQAK